MPLPDDFLQEVKMRNDITDIASSYITLKRTGRNMVGLCPFHGEKTPSFNIYSETNSYYCFGCGAGGDVVNFVMRIENLDYIEAVRYLAQRAGMRMPEDNYDDSLSKLRKRIYEANREAARFFYKTLYSPVGASGLRYFYSRGLTDKTIKHFGLGFAPDSHFELSNYLKNKGFNDDELVLANLVYKNKSGRGTNDRFYNRVMFPIIDVRGNVIAFGGRIMTDQKPKYLNTSDTPVFNKSSNLFSLNNAKKTADRTLILCEGYMDVIAINQAGFQNAVATLGTALTNEQAVLMKRFADDVIICYDADEAGQKATQRAISILRNSGLNIRVLIVPDGKDPDEFIRKNGDNGAAAFYNLINGSANDIEYKINKIKKKYDLSSSEQRVRFLNEVAGILAGIDNRIEQDVYASTLSQELDVSKEVVMQSVLQLGRKKQRNTRKKQFSKLASDLTGRDDKINPQHREELRATHAEETLLSFLVNYVDSYTEISSKISAESFVTDFNKNLFTYFSQKITEGYSPLNTISNDFTQDEVNKIFSIANICRNINPTNEAIEEYVRVLNEEKNKMKTEEIASASDETLSDYIMQLKANRE
ncbi:MAG: DNA primase [Ruminococcus sp.]|nr:DNA primase [Ruminococcus sp.]